MFLTMHSFFLQSNSSRGKLYLLQVPHDVPVLLREVLADAVLAGAGHAPTPLTATLFTLLLAIGMTRNAHEIGKFLFRTKAISDKGFAV